MTLKEFDYFEKSCKKVGKHKKVPDTYFDKKELELGISIEMEHTNDRELATEIAKDHLMEYKDYYSRLKKMEKQAEKYWEHKLTGNTSKDNSHSHKYSVNKKGNGETTSFGGASSHVHKIVNHVVLEKENHIHIIK